MPAPLGVRLQRRLLAGLLLRVWLWAAVAPRSRTDWLLENLLVFFCVAALLVSPELGSAFLGPQGDEWDAQKDAGMAMLGAVLGLLLRRAGRALSGARR